MKKLQESTVSDSVVLRVLSTMGLGSHGILLDSAFTYRLHYNGTSPYNNPVNTAIFCAPNKIPLIFLFENTVDPTTPLYN